MTRPFRLLPPLMAAVGLLTGLCRAEDRAPTQRPGGLVLTLEGVDIRTAVGGLARQNGLNLVGVDKLKGTVTAYLTNVSVQDALDAILKSHGFGLRQSGAIWEIVPKEQEERERAREERERARVDEQLAAEEHEVLLRQFEVKYAELDRAVAALVPGVVPEASQISQYPESGILIVKGTASQLTEVESVLKLIDVPIPQILIRARIFEVSQNRAEDLGVEWKKVTLKSPQDIRMDLSQPIGRPSFMWGYVRGDVELSLEALVEKKAADILSEPQVTTTNNKTATIKVVDKVPVITRTLQIVNEQTITTDAVTFEEAGLTLEVTPRVVGGDHVFLKLSPSVKELVGFTDTTPKQPIINSREATTEVMIRDGAWLVIGGLMRNTINANKRKVPLLGSIPLLGLPFRSKSGTIEKSNLLILVSATILDDDSIGQQTRSATEGLEKLRKTGEKDWVGYEAVRQDLSGLTELPRPDGEKRAEEETAERSPEDDHGKAGKKKRRFFRRKADRNERDEP